MVTLLRTAVLALLRYAGQPSLAAAQRDLALHPAGILELFHDVAQALAIRARSPTLHSLPHRPADAPLALRRCAS